MNVFNRLFTIIGIIVLIVSGTATLIAPATVLSFIQTTANTIHVNVFANMGELARLGVRSLAAVIFVLIMLGLLWLEVRRPAQRTIEVGRYTGGTTIKISTDSIESKIRDSVDSLGGVIGARVSANTRSKAVDVSIDVLATKDTDLVAKAEEVSAITRMIVQDHLGLKLYGKPQVTIKSGAGKAKVDRKPFLPPIGRAKGDESEAAPAPIANTEDEQLKPAAAVSGMAISTATDETSG